MTLKLCVYLDDDVIPVLRGDGVSQDGRLGVTGGKTNNI